MTTKAAPELTMTSADAKAAIRDELESFATDPDKFPTALAARAQMPHRYSLANMLLILKQSGDPDTLADRILPRHEWEKLGYRPAGLPFGIWSKPFIGYTDADGNVTYSKPEQVTEDTRTFKRYRVVATYAARNVRDEHGQTAETVSEPLEGDAGQLYARLVAWLEAQGWTVEVRNVDGAGGWTEHTGHTIRIDGRFTGWERVRVLIHETAHALMHGSNDQREYAGEHRGDMEAEADGVAYAVLTAYGQHETAARAVRYVAEWAKGDGARIEAALERASAALDVVLEVLAGNESAELRTPKTTKGDNRALAAWLRENDLPVRGPVWTAAKQGERDLSALAALASEAA